MRVEVSVDATRDDNNSFVVEDRLIRPAREDTMKIEQLLLH